MRERLILQGREISGSDIVFIKGLLAKQPKMSQWKISREICRQWDWKNDKGQIKDIACRSLLRKLESQGRIILPPRRHKPLPRMKDQRQKTEQLSFFSGISSAQSLKEVEPLAIQIAPPKSADGKLFAALLAHYHYLGYKGSVGEHLAYLIRDCNGKVLACLLFGAPAWRIAPRDQYIGWHEEQRQKNLKLITNNMRFLLLKKIPHLASRLLGLIARRISRDWEEKYGHGIVLLETFVEIERFRGTCYQAANWVKVGQTQGRSRNDRYKKLQVPVKHIYLYPLTRNFKEALCGAGIGKAETKKSAS